MRAWGGQAGHSVWVTGATEALGKWSEGRALPMVHVGDRVYVGQVGAPPLSWSCL